MKIIMILSISGKVHNLCSSDDREYTEDTEAVVAISRCLFRYLLHPSERVRYLQSGASYLSQGFEHNVFGSSSG